MKNIPLNALPTFQSTIIKDLDKFLFEFDILCRTYDYTIDEHKLILSLATFKEFALRWYMGVGVASITSLNGMKKTFFRKVSILLLL